MSGTILTSSAASKYMTDNNRDYNNRLTWQTLLNSNAAEAASAKQKLVNEYTDASSQAYVSYLQSQNAIRNSNIAGAMKNEALSENDLALQEAYNTYRNNLSEGLYEVESSYAEGASAIQDALSTQAEYTAKYANYHRGYLEKLYEQYEAGENKLFDDAKWSKYIVSEPVLDAEGKEQTDANGNIMTMNRLKTAEEMQSELYDSDGNLTIAGVDYFDQLENALANTGGYSWGDYLYETDEDVFNWANSYNPYNYTFDGTNQGTFRTMVGLAADDYEWSFAERFGGMSSDEITAMYDTFKNDVTKLSEINFESSPDKALDQLSTISDNIFSLAESLGIDGDLKDMGFDKETLNQQLQYAYENVKGEGELVGDAFKNIFLSTGAGAAAGLKGGAAGAAVMGAIGLVFSTVTTISNAEKQHDINKQLLTELQNNYKNLLNQMTNYSLQKKRNADIQYANSTGR